MPTLQEKSLMESSVQLTDKAPLIEAVVYSPEEELVKKRLHAEIQYAIQQRDSTHDEFDGQSYIQWWEADEKAANSFIPPKKNKEDANLVTGTTREKMMAILAAVQNLNLTPDVQAFDSQDLELVELGEGIEEIMQKTEYLEGDDEKKLLRQFELLKQGTAFVEDVWIEDSYLAKKLTGKFSGKLDIKWTSRMKKRLPRPERSVLCGLNVYLGDITQFDIDKQP